MKICHALFLGLFCLTSVTVAAQPLRYKFQCHIKAQSRGHFFIIIPYRVFFETNATISFIGKPGNPGFEFIFDKLPATGYLARTAGFSGKSMYLVAADSDLSRCEETIKAKIAHFKNNIPYYSKYIKKIKLSRYQIIPEDGAKITFSRDNRGIHHSGSFLLTKKKIDKNKKVSIYFNIYKILWESLQVYNHSYLPAGKTSLQEIGNQQQWQSPPLNLTNILNRIIKLATRITAKHVKMRQHRAFRLSYQVTKTSEILELKGQAFPDIAIGYGAKIKEFTRIVKIRCSDNLLLEDGILVKMENKKGSGGETRLILRLVE